MLIRMEKHHTHGNSVPSLETRGLILFYFSYGLWKGITVSEQQQQQQQQIPSHQAASSPKQPQVRQKRRSRKKVTKPSRGKTKAAVGTSQSLAQRLLQTVQPVLPKA